MRYSLLDMKISKLAFAFFASCVVMVSSFFAGCASDDIADVSDTPRVVVGVLKYTGATYSPIHVDRPYKYALYDINGNFVAYADTTKFITNRMDVYMDKLIEARGMIMKRDGDMVMRIDSMRMYK